MAKPKQSAALFDQLDKAIQGGEGDEVVGKMKVCAETLILLRVAFIVFDLDCNKALCWKGVAHPCTYQATGQHTSPRQVLR